MEVLKKLGARELSDSFFGKWNGCVPITKNNRLSAKNIFNGKQAMIKLQDNFHEYMVKQGFNLERGESKAETLREHLSVHDLKKNTEKELEQLQEDVKQLTKVVDLSKYVEEIEFEEKNNLIGSFKGSKTVKLASDDFGRIKLLAKQSGVLKMNEKALKNEIRELLEKNRVRTWYLMIRSFFGIKYFASS